MCRFKSCYAHQASPQIPWEFDTSVGSDPPAAQILHNGSQRHEATPPDNAAQNSSSVVRSEDFPTPPVSGQGSDVQSVPGEADAEQDAREASPVDPKRSLIKPVTYRGVIVPIYGKTTRFPYYRIAYPADGKRVVRAFKDYGDVKSVAEAQARELYNGNHLGPSLPQLRFTARENQRNETLEQPRGRLA